MHNFLCQNVQTFQNYILLPRKIKTFWSGSVSSIRNIKLSCSKLFYVFSNIYFGTKCLKKLDKKNFEIKQVFMHNFLRHNN